MATGRGRRMRYRQIPDLELPEELELPTCTACGEQWLDAESTRRVEEALEQAYRAELTRKAEQAIEALRHHIPQRDLERLLGVSAGLLSKVKSGKETSGPMAALLLLLAEQPRRLDELRRLWAVQPEAPRVVELKRVRIQLQPESTSAALFEVQSVPTQTAIQIEAHVSASCDPLLIAA